MAGEPTYPVAHATVTSKEEVSSEISFTTTPRPRQCTDCWFMELRSLSVTQAPFEVHTVCPKAEGSRQDKRAAMSGACIVLILEWCFIGKKTGGCCEGCWLQFRNLHTTVKRGDLVNFNIREIEI